MDLEQQRADSRAMWADGDYPEVARRLGPAADRLVASAGVSAGDRVLDVGTGSGNVALRAARLGAQVLGVDQIDTWFAPARRQAATDDLDLRLVVGDAEGLPAADGAFDAVLSCFAHIFAPRHDVVTREMVRVCRSGGTIAVTAWAHDPDVVSSFDVVREYLDTGAGPSNADWGDPAYLRARFAEHGVDMAIEWHVMEWRFPTVQANEDFVLNASGPYRWVRARLVAAGVWDEAWARMREIELRHNVAHDGSCAMDQDYLLAVGRVP